MPWLSAGSEISPVILFYSWPKNSHGLLGGVNIRRRSGGAQARAPYRLRSVGERGKGGQATG